LAGGRGGEMTRRYLPGVNKSRLMIILIKYWGREKEIITIDFKAVVFSLFVFIPSF
jgi:hypothetical protein